MAIMNDAQKAQEIGRLLAQTSDDGLTGPQLIDIAKIAWPDSKANHMVFMRAYNEEFGRE